MGYVRFPLPDGGYVDVDTGTEEGGVGRVGRGGSVVTMAGVTFEQAIDQVRRAADATLRQFRNMTSRPDEVEIEFGVRLTAEAGAIIAKTEAEAQLTVRIAWTKDTKDTKDTGG